jgi:hypothetical protein
MNRVLDRYLPMVSTSLRILPGIERHREHPFRRRLS